MLNRVIVNETKGWEGKITPEDEKIFKEIFERNKRVMETLANLPSEKVKEYLKTSECRNTMRYFQQFYSCQRKILLNGAWKELNTYFK